MLNILMTSEWRHLSVDRQRYTGWSKTIHHVFQDGEAKKKKKSNTRGERKACLVRQSGRSYSFIHSFTPQ